MSPAAIRVASAILLPLLIGAVLMRHHDLSWRVMLVGALFFMAQAGAQAPVLGGVIALAGYQQSPQLLALLGAILFGFFQEISRWLAFTSTETMRRYRSWGAAMLYGAGHGGAQALRFIFLAATLPALAQIKWLGSTTSIVGIAISLDRVPSIVFQCGLSAIVMFGVLKKRPRYLFIAMVWHIALNILWFSLLVQNNVFVADLLMLGGAAGALGFALVLRQRWPVEPELGEYVPLRASQGIVIDDLTRTYPGVGKEPSVTAVSGLSLTVHPGKVLALLGHNGAGKTTTLRMLGGLLAPTSGRANVAGFDVRVAPGQVRRVVGLESEEGGLYRHMPVAAYLDFFARLYDVPRVERVRRIERLLNHLNLSEKRDAPCGSLSKGTRQKVALARTLIHEPRVLLLDEPTSALDPAVTLLVRELIMQLKGEGRTIVLATHNLHEAQALADEVAIVHQGRLIRSGTVAELRSDGDGRRYTLRIATPHPPLGPVLERLGGVDMVREATVVSDGNRPEGAVLSFRTKAPEKSNPEVLSTLLAMGLKPYALSESRPTLEQVYLDIDRQLESVTEPAKG